METQIPFGNDNNLASEDEDHEGYVFRENALVRFR